ncbi:MAG: Major surface antigen 4 [Wolbachia endosymbiont of Ctenocephalides orientis wCori]|nr:MAG: Major surface antigen 4 [Wolbachia endosymbiont of Ctenocephalides orientis wCori]
MHYTKFFSAAALVAVLGLSHSAFSDPVGPISTEETSYYVHLQYNGDFLPFETDITGVTAKKSDNTTVIDPFEASYIGGGAEFGYIMDDVRVGFEGVYSRLNKNALADAVFDPTTPAENLTAISGLVNVYYDIAIEDAPVTPYVGIGVGGAYLNNPSKAAAVKDQKSFGVAYQAKVGVNYEITPEIKFYAGGRYFGSYGAKFDKASVNDVGISKVLYSTIGAEAGVSFHF